MSRVILVIVAVLSLCLGPYAASAHGTSMVFAAAMQSSDSISQHKAHDHEPKTTSDCGTKTHCGMDAAACASVCAAISVIQPIAEMPSANQVSFRIDRVVSGDLLTGIAPELNDRPPQYLSPLNPRPWA